MDPSWILDTGDVYRLHPHHHSRQLILLYYLSSLLPEPELYNLEQQLVSLMAVQSERRCRCVSAGDQCARVPALRNLPAHLQARDNDVAVTMFRAGAVLQVTA